jgi:hypothetical protein
MMSMWLYVAGLALVMLIVTMRLIVHDRGHRYMPRHALGDIRFLGEGKWLEDWANGKDLSW